MNGKRCLGWWTALLTLAACGGCAGPTRAQTPDFMVKPSLPHVRIVCYNINWDAIFEDDDPNNHEWRNFDKSDEFVRVVRALDPDILCLQEINWSRDPQDVGDILNEVIPLGSGQTWRMHIGSDNVIASRYDLSMLGVDTDPTTNRGQAMALVHLPDAAFGRDLYLMNAHFKAAGGDTNIARRRQHADAIISWIRDIKTPGGNIDLPTGTAIAVMGDLNVYETDPHYHLTTLITGDIVDEGTYGPNTPPDWDETDSTDALPLHNGVGPDFYTWRNDSGSFNPGDLDHIIFTDSVMSIGNSFVLNTDTMSPQDLSATELQAGDVALDLSTGYFDHLPLVVDFLITPSECTFASGDIDGDGEVTLVDFTSFTNCFGQSSVVSQPCKCSDLNQDGEVGLDDFTTFAVRFGQPPEF